MENFIGGQKLFVHEQKYGISKCLNDHKIITLCISLKICILDKSIMVFPFLEFIKPELQVHQL